MQMQRTVAETWVFVIWMKSWIRSNGTPRSRDLRAGANREMTMSTDTPNIRSWRRRRTVRNLLLRSKRRFHCIIRRHWAQISEHAAARYISKKNEKELDRLELLQTPLQAESCIERKQWECCDGVEACTTEEGSENHYKNGKLKRYGSRESERFSLVLSVNGWQTCEGGKSFPA